MNAEALCNKRLIVWDITTLHVMNLLVRRPTKAVGGLIK